MNEEREFDPNAYVRDIIAYLLGSTLPAELATAAPALVDRVAEHPDVACHMGKRWHELSEGEGNIVAREVGLVARDVLIGSGGMLPGGRQVH